MSSPSLSITEVFLKRKVKTEKNSPAPWRNSCKYLWIEPYIDIPNIHITGWYIYICVLLNWKLDTFMWHIVKEVVYMYKDNHECKTIISLLPLNFVVFQGQVILLQFHGFVFPMHLTQMSKIIKIFWMDINIYEVMKLQKENLAIKKYHKHLHVI